MDTIIGYFDNYTVFDLFSAIIVIIVIVRGIERFIKWCFGYLKKYYEKKRGIEKKDDIITAHTKEIKTLVERMDRMVSSVDSHYTLLLQKLDDQEKRLEQFDDEGKNRDCAILRDRILQSIKYFSKNHIVDGNVHINITEWENINAMFEEYFKAHGNGAVKKIYDEEFSKWIIDN